ncbi:MAG: hypothetical protein HWN67_13180 [Candidatus Helarchaeota archaeon]|nr:hypothetical protein [Candidatus Helarchaeota archaeon]
MKRLLAKVCVVCPVCNLVRKNPYSKFADIWRKVEKFCPFCRAYYSMHNRTNEK